MPKADTAYSLQLSDLSHAALLLKALIHQCRPISQFSISTAHARGEGHRSQRALLLLLLLDCHL